MHEATARRLAEHALAERIGANDRIADALLEALVERVPEPDAQFAWNDPSPGIVVLSGDALFQIAVADEAIGLAYRRVDDRVLVKVECGVAGAPADAHTTCWTFDFPNGDELVVDGTCGTGASEDDGEAFARALAERVGWSLRPAGVTV